MERCCLDCLLVLFTLGLQTRLAIINMILALFTFKRQGYQISFKTSTLIIVEWY